MESQWLKVHPKDTVVVVLRDFAAGETLDVEGGGIVLKEDVPSGHKVAVTEGKVGEDIIKYGYPIGKASASIQVGEWVHTHNLHTGLTGTRDYEYLPAEIENTQEASPPPTFQGYVRKNGDVGVRNEIWIINTVGCINKTAELIARLANERFHRDGVDGVYHFPHPFGCSQLGDDLRHTQKILAALVHHPNAAGILVLGLGCENNYLASFKEVIGPYEKERVKFLGVQETVDEIEEGLKRVEELIDYAASFSRQPLPISRLRVGLKCGGSDGFSGITANPLVGAFSDRLITYGGTAVLTEVPEMFGAETILMQRADNQHVFEQMVGLINGFKDYFIKHEQPVYENPSPGNKEGGITTLEEKSLGCVQKGGFAPVVDVLPYGGRVSKPGLNIVQGPGNDLVSVTALSASGAHIVLFTTGRGTPFGGPVPTVKISTNSRLYEKKRNWIDFNAGSLLDDTDMETLSSDLFEYVIRLASGEINTKNEQFGYKEIAIFKDGVIL